MSRPFTSSGFNRPSSDSPGNGRTSLYVHTRQVGKDGRPATSQHASKSQQPRYESKESSSYKSVEVLDSLSRGTLANAHDLLPVVPRPPEVQFSLGLLPSTSAPGRRYRVHVIGGYYSRTAAWLSIDSSGPGTSSSSRPTTASGARTPGFMAPLANEVCGLLGYRKSTSIVAAMSDAALIRRRLETQLMRCWIDDGIPPVKKRHAVGALVKLQMIYEYFIVGEGSKHLTNPHVIHPLDPTIVNKMCESARSALPGQGRYADGSARPASPSRAVSPSSGRGSRARSRSPSPRQSSLPKGFSVHVSDSNAARTLRKCAAEVEVAYNMAMRRSIVDYVMRSPEERERLKVNACLTDLQQAWREATAGATEAVDPEIALLMAGSMPWQRHPVHEAYSPIPLRSGDAPNSISWFSGTHAVLVDIPPIVISEGNSTTSLCFSVPFTGPRESLAAEPLHPVLLAGMNAGAPLVTSTVCTLAVLLGRTNSLLRFLSNAWHDVLGADTRFVAVPSSHEAALGRSASVSTVHQQVLAWETMTVDDFVASQTGHTDRVRAALMKSWYANANDALDAFARSYVAIIAAVAPPHQTLSTTASDAVDLPPSRDDFDLGAIADGDGPFAMPLSIRDQLDKDERLRIQMKRSLAEYSDYLQRQKGLLQAASAVQHAAKPGDAESIGSPQPGRVVMPLYTEQLNAVASMLGACFPAGSASASSWRRAWLHAHDPASATTAGASQSSSPPSPLQSLHVGPDELEVLLERKSGTPLAMLERASKISNRSARPFSGSSLRPQPPPRSPQASKNDRRLLATTRWRLAQDHGLKPLPRDAESTSLELAVEAYPASLPACLNASIHCSTSALLSIQMREACMRSLAALTAFFLRFVPRRSRLVVDKLLGDYQRRELSALEARSAANALAIARQVEAAEQEMRRQAAIAAVEAKRQEFESRMNRQRAQTVHKSVSTPKEQFSPHGTGAVHDRGMKAVDVAVLDFKDTVSPRLQHRRMSVLAGIETIKLDEGLGLYFANLVREAMNVDSGTDLRHHNMKMNASLLGQAFEPVFVANLEINQSFTQAFANVSTFRNGAPSRMKLDPLAVASPLIYAFNVRRLRATCANAGIEVMTPSQYVAWKDRSETLGSLHAVPRDVPVADATIPFKISPSFQQVQAAVVKVVETILRASEDIPTVAFARSVSWKKSQQAPSRPSSPSKFKELIDVPLHVPNPVSAEHDVFELPTLNWLITGSSNATWTPTHQFLSAMKADEALVQYATGLVSDVVEQNLVDAVKIMDIFEPFSYLLLEPARIDLLLEHSAAHFDDIETCFDKLAEELQRGSSRTEMHPPTAAPPAPLLSLELCEQLIRQYKTSIQALEHAVHDVCMNDVDNVKYKYTGSAALATGVARSFSRRGSDGFTTKELENSLLSLPLSLSLDLFKLDCSHVVKQLLHTAHSCLARIAGYIDDRCSAIFKASSMRSTSMIHLVRQRPSTPGELNHALEVYEKAAHRVAPALFSIVDATMEELVFLLAVELPSLAKSASPPHATGSSGLEADGIVGIDDAADTSRESSARNVEGPTLPQAAVLPTELSLSDRIGGASINTLESAVTARQWQRCIPGIMLQVSTMHSDVRNWLENSIKERRMQAVEIIGQAITNIDRIRLIPDAAMVHAFMHTTAIKSLIPLVKPLVDEMIPIVDSLQLARMNLVAVTKEEEGLRLYRNTEEIKTMVSYLTRISTNKTSADLPWGSSLDLLNLNADVVEVDVCFAAIEPLVGWWSTARDLFNRIDRWYTGPIFTLERSEVQSRIDEMFATIAKSKHQFNLHIPTVADFIATMKKPFACAPAEEVASDDAQEAHRASVARKYGMEVTQLLAEDNLETLASAAEARLSSFVTRGQPLIRVLCNPNLTHAHWDRINAIAGAKIGPPSAKQRGIQPAAATKSNRLVSDGALSSRTEKIGDTPAPARPGSVVDNASRRGSVASAADSYARFAGTSEADDEFDALDFVQQSAQQDRYRPSSVLSAHSHLSDNEAVPAAQLGATFLAMLTSTGLPPSTPAAAAARGPTLQQLIEAYNLDDRIAELLRVSDEADRAAA